MSQMGNAMERSAEQGVARREQQDRQRQTVTSLLGTMSGEIQRALPTGMSGDRVARIALTLVRQSQLSYSSSKLGDCDPQSFAAALMTSVALGLEPGVNGESYLIPYKRECALVVGYQGMIKLGWQHPTMHNMGSGFVWPEDDFDYEQGMDPFLRHKPAKGVKRDEKAWPEVFYAWATLKTGGRHMVVLSRDEVRALRQGKEGVDPKFKGGDPQHWMSRKTCLRQLLKPLPKSVRAGWAIQVDEQSGGALYAQQVPQQIAAQVEGPDDKPALEQAPDSDAGQYANAEQAAAQGDPWEVGS